MRTELEQQSYRLKQTIQKQTLSLSDELVKQLQYFVQDLPNKKQDVKQESILYVEKLQELFK